MRWLGYLGLVVVGTAGLFAWQLDQEPFFADESAHIAQTYYYRLLKSGDTDHVNWVHVAAYDHTPIYKYWIGAYLDLAGDDTSIPESTEAWERWMSGQFDPPRSAKTLYDARLSMLLGAVLGCALIFTLGWQTVGLRTGLLAAIFLATSPLYYTHARRAMADDLTQALVLAAFVAMVAMVRMLSSSARGHWLAAAVAAVIAGSFAGLAAATKLNGITALASIVLFALVVALARFRQRMPGAASVGMFLGMSALVCAAAAAIFIGSNPYFYAHPPVIMDASGRIAGIPRNEAMAAEMTRVADLSMIGRMQNLLEHRTESLKESMPRFAEYALPTVASRARAIVVEGIGRWSFAGRLPPPRALGITIGTLAAAAGFIYLVMSGVQQRSTGVIPIAWLLALWPMVEVLMLLRTLMLDWDRYYMGVVTWTAFLAAVGIGGGIQAVAKRLFLPPPGSEAQ